MSVTRVKNFNIDNGTSENTFSQPYIRYMVNERLQGREKLYSKNALLLGQNEIQKLYEFNSLIQKLYTRFARSCF